MQEAGAAIQNKIGQFISNPLVRNFIGQSRSSFNLREMMDNKKIIIINLSKGRVGEANANLLGSMLITKIYLAAMSRADASPGLLKKLPNFYLYVDEFQSFANESFADILSEARKYNLSLTIAHQYIEQMSDEVRAAVFGNVGTMVCFRVGAYDAEVLEKEFAPVFTEQDLVNLGFVQVYLKLMIDGVTSPPFSAVTLPPIEKPIVSFKEDILHFSRTTYARPRAEVEEAIKKWHEPLTSQAHQNAPRVSRPQEPQKELPSRGPAPASLTQQPQQSSQPSRPMPVSPPKPVSREAEENELRKIISLNYAQSNQSKDKKKNLPKKDKGPTPQNMSALREALTSVIKEANLATNPAQQKVQVTKPESPKPQQPLQPQQIIKESRPNPEREHAPEPPRSQGPKEVPEDVLRRVLELDK
jgi:hypothetical protein